MKSKLKKLTGICLAMFLAFSVTLPVYARTGRSSMRSGYKFDEQTGHLIIGRDIERKPVTNIVPFPTNKIKKVTFTNDVICIDLNAFQGCQNLKEVNIPNSVMFIGAGAFRYCIRLTSVTLPYSVTSIESYTFFGCTSLKEVNIPPRVYSIGDYAFSFCKNLKEIRIPNSVFHLGDYAFSFCTSLREVTIPFRLANTTYSKIFLGCPILKKTIY